MKELLFNKQVIGSCVCDSLATVISNINSGLILITGLKGTGKTEALNAIRERYSNECVIRYKSCKNVPSKSIEKVLNLLQNTPVQFKRLFLIDDLHNVRDLRNLHFNDYDKVIVVATTDQFTASAVELNGNVVERAIDMTVLNYNLFKDAYLGTDMTVDKYIEYAGSICNNVDSVEYLAKGLEIFLYNRVNLRAKNYVFMSDLDEVISHEFKRVFTELVDTYGDGLKSHRTYAAIKRQYMCELDRRKHDFEVSHEIFKEVSLYYNIGNPVMLFGSQVVRLMGARTKNTEAEYTELTNSIDKHIYEQLYKILVLIEIYRRNGTSATYNSVVNDESAIIVNDTMYYKVCARNVTDIVPVPDGFEHYTVIYGGDTRIEGNVTYINYEKYFKDIKE